MAMRLGVTPVPIPNTMVKTQAADGTLLETARESRWLPVFNEKIVLLYEGFIYKSDISSLYHRLKITVF